jgi:hypothetical protein
MHEPFDFWVLPPTKRADVWEESLLSGDIKNFLGWTKFTGKKNSWGGLLYAD